MNVVLREVAVDFRGSLFVVDLHGVVEVVNVGDIGQGRDLLGISNVNRDSAIVSERIIGRLRRDNDVRILGQEALDGVGHVPAISVSHIKLYFD